MSKFNTKNQTNPTERDAVNYSGMPGFSRKNFKGEVVSVILNSMLSGKDSFYETEKARLAKIEGYVTNNPQDSMFLAKAMVYTRNEGNLRSVSHFMGTLLTENVKGEKYLKNALSKTMIRPDDATEMVALWNARHPNKMIPNSLRKAVKISLEDKWDAYQLKKYFGNGSVKVSNLINICHPTPKDENQRVMFKMALENKLPAIDTAQTVNAGSTGEERAENYAKMLSERKLGYMAALKNIKNIIEAGSNDTVVEMLCDLLSNENAVLKSRVLPFRFVDAYNTVKIMRMNRLKANKILKAIEQGFIYSSKNISIVEDGESVAILLDDSGSMGWMKEPAKTPFNIGKTLMASMLCGLDKDRTLGYLWSDNARRISIDSSPMDFIEKTRAEGGGTNLGRAIVDLINTKTAVDKIVIFTDMQENQVGHGDGSFQNMVAKYRKISPNTKFLFWNLEGYGGATPMKLSHGILEVSGFSDSMLSIITKLWKDQDALVKEIEAIEL